MRQTERERERTQLFFTSQIRAGFVCTGWYLQPKSRIFSDDFHSSHDSHTSRNA